jgi:1-acyl-sn-glycerol-3-phosphate acyltransferase
MKTPALNRLGRLLPAAWQRVILRHSQGVDLAAILADPFLEYPADERGFDPVATKRSFFLVEQLLGRYFRVSSFGAENIPPGGVIILASHSGVMPWDATLLVPEIYRLTGRFSWNAGHEFWGRYAPLRTSLVPTGMVLGGMGEFEALLRRGEICTIFADAGQGNRRAYYLESERYKVKPVKGFAPGHGGYIKLALHTGRPIVPVAIVGTEEIHYCLGDIPQAAELLRMPFFPIVASILPLPAHIYIRFGEPIHLEAPPEAAGDQRFVDRLNERVRGALQALLDDTLHRRHGIYWSSYDASSADAVPYSALHPATPPWRPLAGVPGPRRGPSVQARGSSWQEHAHRA